MRLPLPLVSTALVVFPQLAFGSMRDALLQSHESLHIILLKRSWPTDGKCHAHTLHDPHMPLLASVVVGKKALRFSSSVRVAVIESGANSSVEEPHFFRYRITRIAQVFRGVWGVSPTKFRRGSFGSEAPYESEAGSEETARLVNFGS